MQEITKFTEWVSDMKIGEVKRGRIFIGKDRSLRNIVLRFNQSIGYMRSVYVHMSYDYITQEVTLVCTSRDDRETTKNDINHANDWKKNI